MKKLFLLLLTVATFAIASAQTRVVTGQVVYAGDGEPLIGATVLPLGGASGTATNVDGEFSIRVAANVTKLIVSYVGMVTQEVAITESPMVIRLTNKENKLDEVMVVAYGTAKKSEFTGAASVVDASQIEDRNVTNIINALTGTVAGVQTQSANGQPGTSPTVRIRGVGSINAESKPLYVLDGMPYDGDIATVNPSDIESMTVLKDAAAAALYGARGANGVILVTTKRGKQGNARVALEARWGANSRQVTNYDVISDPAQYMELAYTAQRNAALYRMGYTPEDAHAYANGQLKSMLGYQVYTVADGESLIGANGKINPNARLGYSDGNNYFIPDNWADITFRNGMRQEYNLSVSGANERLNYFISASYVNDQGIIDNSDYERFTTRTSIDYQVNKWLKIGTNVSYAFAKSAYPGEQTTSNSSSNAFFMANAIAPIYPIFVRDADGTIQHNEATGYRVYDYGDRKQTAFARAFMPQANPAGSLLYDTTDYLTDLFNGKWFAQINPIAGLTVTGTVGLMVDNTRTHQIVNKYYGQYSAYNGIAYQGYERVKALNLQALANYRRTFKDVHTFDILLGVENYSYNDEALSGQGYNLYNPNSWTVNNTLNNPDLPRSANGSYGEYATRGYFGRINYDYDTRYFVSFSYRRDGSSRFAPDKRYGNFYSASAAWDIAQETWAQDAKWLDQLKVRASFGQQGNDDIGNYYAYLDQYQITGATTWSDGKLAYKGNPDLTWEKSNSTNVGVDFSFWNYKLSGTIEYFNRQTSDMLYNKPVAPSLGYSSIPMNVGSMRNNGVELELSFRPIITRHVEWELKLNNTYVENKVLKLAPELNGEWIDGSFIYREGDSRYQLYLVKYAGVDPATGRALYWAWDEDDNGNRTYYTTPNWASKWRQATGNLFPKMYGGFGTNLNIYGFDLSCAFSYQVGGKIYDTGYQRFMGSGATSEYGVNWHKDILKAWTPENPNTDVPRLDTLDDYSFYGTMSDRGLISSNYLALNNVTVGYTLPQKLTRKFFLEKVRVYGSADNVAIWSARKGLDPRQSYTSATTSIYTAMRCISGGIKVEF